MSYSHVPLKAWCRAEYTRIDFTDKQPMSRLWCFYAGMRPGLAGQAAFRTMEGRMHCSAGAVARAQCAPPQRPHQSSHRAAEACARAAMPRSAGRAVACCPADSTMLAGSACTRCVPTQPSTHHPGMAIPKTSKTSSSFDCDVGMYSPGRCSLNGLGAQSSRRVQRACTKS